MAKTLKIAVTIPDSATPATWGQIRTLLGAITPADDSLIVDKLSAPINVSLAGLQLAVVVE